MFRNRANVGRSRRFAFGKHVTEAGVACGRSVFALELVTLRERTGARRPPGGAPAAVTRLSHQMTPARRLRVPLSWRRRLLYLTVMWHPSCVRRGFFRAFQRAALLGAARQRLQGFSLR